MSTYCNMYFYHWNFTCIGSFYIWKHVYKGLLECVVKTRNSWFLMTGAPLGLHQQCGVRVLVYPWQHQVTYEWQQEETCVGLAYITQHMGGEDRYRSLKGGGVGTQILQFQSQQREALSPYCRLSTNATLPIPRSHFRLTLNSDATQLPGLRSPSAATYQHW